jgi:hypothetical protein
MSGKDFSEKLALEMRKYEADFMDKRSSYLLLDRNRHVIQQLLKRYNVSLKQKKKQREATR